MQYHRYYIPNSLVFITQVVHGRAAVFTNHEYLALLRSILHIAQEQYPFHMLGYVFLPDHFHMLIRPEFGITHSRIMHSIKPAFTRAYKQSLGITGTMHFWQRRYWDHVIRDEADLERHLDYIHYNPVKHGYVAKPEDWADSSFHHWQQRGFYPAQWGWSVPQTIQDVQHRFAE